MVQSASKGFVGASSMQCELDRSGMASPSKRIRDGGVESLTVAS